MRNISNDLSNKSYKRVYLLYGSENYLKKQYKNNFVKSVCDGDTINYNYFEGKGIDIKTIIDTCDTAPFFANYRLVVIEDSGCMKNSNDELGAYIKNIPESTVLVFIETEIDKRNKVYKEVNSCGYVCEMNEQNVQTLSKWIRSMFAKDNKQIADSVISFMIDLIGNNMENIANEIEKLVCYVGERTEITVEDVKDICVVTLSSKVFDMIDALGYKNRKKALSIYYDLIAQKEAPMMILYMLNRQFNILVQVKELSLSGVDAKTIASRMSMQPFIINKALKQAEKFKYKVLREALEEGVEFDEKIKQGNISDKMAVEMLLIKYSE